MAARPPKGTRAVYMDMAADLAEALEQEATETGKSFREVCERRLRSADPPIPGPEGVEPVRRPRGRPRKRREGETP